MLLFSRKSPFTHFSRRKNKPVFPNYFSNSASILPSTSPLAPPAEGKEQKGAVPVDISKFPFLFSKKGKNFAAVEEKLENDKILAQSDPLKTANFGVQREEGIGGSFSELSPSSPLSNPGGQGRSSTPSLLPRSSPLPRSSQKPSKHGSPPKAGDRWTAEEERVIKKLCELKPGLPSLSAKELCAHPELKHRSEGAIKLKLKQLGLLTASDAQNLRDISERLRGLAMVSGRVVRKEMESTPLGSISSGIMGRLLDPLLFLEKFPQKKLMDLEELKPKGKGKSFHVARGGRGDGHAQGPGGEKFVKQNFKNFGKNGGFQEKFKNIEKVNGKHVRQNGALPIENVEFEENVEIPDFSESNSKLTSSFLDDLDSELSVLTGGSSPESKKNSILSPSFPSGKSYKNKFFSSKIAYFQEKVIKNGENKKDDSLEKHGNLYDIDSDFADFSKTRRIEKEVKTGRKSFLDSLDSEMSVCLGQGSPEAPTPPSSGMKEEGAGETEVEVEVEVEGRVVGGIQGSRKGGEGQIKSPPKSFFQELDVELSGSSAGMEEAESPINRFNFRDSEQASRGEIEGVGKEGLEGDEGVSLSLPGSKKKRFAFELGPQAFEEFLEKVVLTPLHSTSILYRIARFHNFRAFQDQLLLEGGEEPFDSSKQESDFMVSLRSNSFDGCPVRQKLFMHGAIDAIQDKAQRLRHVFEEFSQIEPFRVQLSTSSAPRSELSFIVACDSSSDIFYYGKGDIVILAPECKTAKKFLKKAYSKYERRVPDVHGSKSWPFDYPSLVMTDTASLSEQQVNVSCFVCAQKKTINAQNHLDGEKPCVDDSCAVFLEGGVEEGSFAALRTFSDPKPKSFPRRLGTAPLLGGSRKSESTRIPPWVEGAVHHDKLNMWTGIITERVRKGGGIHSVIKVKVSPILVHPRSAQTSAYSFPQGEGEESSLGEEQPAKVPIRGESSSNWVLYPVTDYVPPVHKRQLSGLHALCELDSSRLTPQVASLFLKGANLEKLSKVNRKKSEKIAKNQEKIKKNGSGSDEPAPVFTEEGEINLELYESKSRPFEKEEPREPPRKATHARSVVFPLTASQRAVVDSACDPSTHVTLVEGPPGTGKSQVVVEIVRKWVEDADNSPILVCAGTHAARVLLHKKLENAGLKIKKNRHDWKGDSPVFVETIFSAAIPKERELKRVIIDECSQVSTLAALVSLAQGASRVVLLGDLKQLGPVSGSESFLESVMKNAALKEGEEEGNEMDDGGDGESTPLAPPLPESNLSVKKFFLDTQMRMIPQVAEFPSSYFYGGRLQNHESVYDLEKRLAGFPLPEKFVEILNPQPKGETKSVCFIDTQGIGREEFDFKVGSYRNEIEAQLALHAVDALLTTGRAKVQNIGLVSAYNSQRTLLRRKLHKLDADKPKQRRAFGERYLFIKGLGTLDGAPDPCVDSIDAYQGSERDWIIFSAVRSNLDQTVGFLKDDRRINVMLTRARIGLLVIGDSTTLKSSPVWTAWLDYVKESGTYAKLVRDDALHSTAAKAARKLRFEPSRWQEGIVLERNPHALHSVKPLNMRGKWQGICGSWNVEVEIDRDHGQEVVHCACDCIDAKYGREGRCKHTAALIIRLRKTELNMPDRRATMSD